MTQSIFIETLPILVGVLAILGTVIWNMIELKSFRKEMYTEIIGIRERLAKIEQRLDDAHIGSSIISSSH